MAYVLHLLSLVPGYCWRNVLRFCQFIASSFQTGKFRKVDVSLSRLETLPDELKLIIIEELRPRPDYDPNFRSQLADLAALAQTSKRLHGIANEALYSTIPLEENDWPTNALLLTTLITRREYVELIKKIHLRIFNSRPRHSLVVSDKQRRREEKAMRTISETMVENMETLRPNLPELSLERRQWIWNGGLNYHAVLPLLLALCGTTPTFLLSPDMLQGHPPTGPTAAMDLSRILMGLVLLGGYF
jgi:hypothetical protein